MIGQSIEKKDLYGTWQVTKNLTKTTDPNLKDLIEGFLVSTFKLEESGTFELKSPNKSALFMMTLEMINNKKWKFNYYRQLIMIGSEKDSFSIMGIYVKQNSDIMIFQISESALEFEMVKI